VGAGASGLNEELTEAEDAEEGASTELEGASLLEGAGTSTDELGEGAGAGGAWEGEGAGDGAASLDDEGVGAGAGG
jgi:hypothetical protein